MPVSSFCVFLSLSAVVCMCMCVGALAGKLVMSLEEVQVFPPASLEDKKVNTNSNILQLSQDTKTTGKNLANLYNLCAACHSSIQRSMNILTIGLDSLHTVLYSYTPPAIWRDLRVRRRSKIVGYSCT